MILSSVDLPVPFGSDDADLGAVEERQGDVVEDDLVAVCLADVAQREDVLSHGREAYGGRPAPPKSVRPGTRPGARTARSTPFGSDGAGRAPGAPARHPPSSGSVRPPLAVELRQSPAAASWMISLTHGSVSSSSGVPRAIERHEPRWCRAPGRGPRAIASTTYVVELWPSCAPTRRCAAGRARPPGRPCGPSRGRCRPARASRLTENQEVCPSTQSPVRSPDPRGHADPEVGDVALRASPGGPRRCRPSPGTSRLPRSSALSSCRLLPTRSKAAAGVRRARRRAATGLWRRPRPPERLARCLAEAWTSRTRQRSTVASACRVVR